MNENAQKETITSLIKTGNLIHKFFEEQVERTPRHTAVVFKETEFTYQEINDKANSLANYLRNEFQVKKNKTVALITEKSERMLIGMLAILKAGGAYVSIDPKYPKSLVNYILEDSKAEALLVDSQYIHLVRGYEGRLCLIDIEPDALEQHSNLESYNEPHDLAYVIYTSGTSGKRKGVAIAHEAILNTLQWRKKYYSFNEQDVTFQIPSYSFDSSVEDIFTTLLSGGKLVLPEEDLKTDPVYFNQQLETHQVSNFLITPTFYSRLLPLISNKQGALKFVTVAGEKMTKELVDSHFEKFPDVALVNEYGPTENAVCSTVKKLSQADEIITIGKPIDGTTLVLLNEQLQPVSGEEAGEIYLGGKGLAVGYFGREELTNKKFINHPSNPKERLYSTGDIGKYTTNGEVEFIGRKDNQVKIRGYRIEPEEVANKLLQITSVSEAAVLPIYEGQGKQATLVAFYTTQEPIKVDTLRESLQLELPEYMVPSHFILIGSMPINHNGKLDQVALKAVYDSHNMNKVSTRSKPMNDFERSIANIWNEALQTSEICLEDNFFEIGGDSLKVIDIGAKVYSEFGVSISGPELYNYPTLARFSEFLQNKLTTE